MQFTLVFIENLFSVHMWDLVTRFTQMNFDKYILLNLVQNVFFRRKEIYTL